jgi:hypothetical protein
VTGGHCSICGFCVWLRHSSLFLTIVVICRLFGSDVAVVGPTAGGPGEVPRAAGALHVAHLSTAVQSIAGH